MDFELKNKRDFDFFRKELGTYYHYFTMETHISKFCDAFSEHLYTNFVSTRNQLQKL